MKPFFRYNNNHEEEKTYKFVFGVKFLWEEFFALPQKIWYRIFTQKKKDDGNN